MRYTFADAGNGQLELWEFDERRNVYVPTGRFYEEQQDGEQFFVKRAERILNLREVPRRTDAPEPIVINLDNVPKETIADALVTIKENTSREALAQPAAAIHPDLVELLEVDPLKVAAAATIDTSAVVTTTTPAAEQKPKKPKKAKEQPK